MNKIKEVVCLALVPASIIAHGPKTHPCQERRRISGAISSIIKCSNAGGI